MESPAARRAREYIVFHDEGHGFTKKKNQIEGYSAVLKFLDTHLKGKAAGNALIQYLLNIDVPV